MNDSPAPISAPYAGLHVRSADLFPLTCGRCGQSFSGLPDFIARTAAVFQSSGLIERRDPASETFVLLMRNCPCGTSLALSCQDRRDRSETGALRRRRYEILVELLIESGDAPPTAREQARLVLRENA